MSLSPMWPYETVDWMTAAWYPLDLLLSRLNKPSTLLFSPYCLLSYQIQKGFFSFSCHFFLVSLSPKCLSRCGSLKCKRIASEHFQQEREPPWRSSPDTSQHPTIKINGNVLQRSGNSPKKPLQLPVDLFGLLLLSFSNSSCWCLALKRHTALRAAGCITIPRTLCLQQILFPLSTCMSCWVVKCGFKPPCHSWLGRHFTGDTGCILLERWKPLSRLEWGSMETSRTSPLCLTTKCAVAFNTHTVFVCDTVGYNMRHSLS